MQVQSMRMVPKLTQQEWGSTNFELKRNIKVGSNLHGGKGGIVLRGEILNWPQVWILQ